MADHSGLSKSTVGRIWRKFQIKPHLTDTFKLSTDPFFVEKVYDVVGLYFNPPEGAVVLSVDEKSQIQALDRSQPVLPIMPGMPERRTHDYVRNGLTTLFATDLRLRRPPAGPGRHRARRPRPHQPRRRTRSQEPRLRQALGTL